MRAEGPETEMAAISMPPLMFTLPVKVFLLERLQLPASDLTSASAPPLGPSEITSLMVFIPVFEPFNVSVFVFPLEAEPVTFVVMLKNRALLVELAVKVASPLRVTGEFMESVWLVPPPLV